MNRRIPFVAFALVYGGASRADLRTTITASDLRLLSSTVSISGHLAGPSPVMVSKTWNQSVCRFRVTNTSNAAVSVKQVTLFSIGHQFSADTPFYGEGFQMLSQTGGTLGNMVDIGAYTDRNHYRLRPAPGAYSVYGMMSLSPKGAPVSILSFTSCRRFSGRFDIYPDRIDVVVDTENMTLKPGESWELEEFQVINGSDRSKLLSKVATQISKNHRPLLWKSPPGGWCSWYCFGPSLTAKQVVDNLSVISRDLPTLKYVQIDDGYQKATGDWLETGKAFGGDIKGVLKLIKEKGFDPAIWVAPFVASGTSDIFRTHPDWFISDNEGKPLRADKVTFGGWQGPSWYALDGTHPAVQAHFENLFRTMNKEWGCTYFKLDATFWGALPGGHFHDKNATRIQAYRRGMAAILKGAGGSFVLGCNHPIWPSFGVINGSRSSGDISREWNVFKMTSSENLNRNWQNGTLWWNDPDCLVLSGKLPQNEYDFHFASVIAAGGLVLSGDDLTTSTAQQKELIRQAVKYTGVSASFMDDRLEIGCIERKTYSLHVLLNREDTAKELTVHTPVRCKFQKLQTGETVSEGTSVLTLSVPPHSGIVLIAKPVEQ